MTTANRQDSGFSLVELMAVLVVLGVLLSFGLPSFQHYSQAQQLRGACENLVQTIQLQRSRAMGTGADVVLNFNTTAPAAWTVVGAGRSVRTPLPKGVVYASAVPGTLTLGRDGRVNTSGLVVLRNRAGASDTVSIQVSGLALIR